MQAAGVEMAPHGIQINAIAQNFVDNPTYFPEETKANPAFQERLKREVPLGRLVSMHEGMPSLLPISALMPQIALSGRCFLSVGAGLFEVYLVHQLAF